MSDFLPVLLGSDANVYGMARSFYQQYGVRSVAICKGALVATSNTNLVKIAVLEPDLENDETFVKTLTDYAKAHADKPLVLVSCADGYTVLMGRHRDALKPYYQLCGYLIYYNEKTSFKEVFEKSLAIPDYFHYLCN